MTEPEHGDEADERFEASGELPPSDEPIVESEGVEDISPEAPEEELPFVYSITAYGADYPVDALIGRLSQNDIVVPEFQRGFIWPRARIDRFVESLLLGLPVPGIFLANEPGTNRLLVIDGQQRLLTLSAYYKGLLRGKEFALGNGVQEQFKGRKYETLDDEDRRRLDNSIIHATVIRQDHPTDDQSSIYFVFERLNTGGTVLQPQEIRAAIYGGPFNDLLQELNGFSPWREIFGPISKRRKDQELILRFFAFRYNLEKYRRPMKEFLNDFMGANRHLEKLDAGELTEEFHAVIEFLTSVFDPSKLFRPGGRAINAALFDAMTVAGAQVLETLGAPDPERIRSAYDSLVVDEDFQRSYTRATADEASVNLRIQMAADCFAAG